MSDKSRKELLELAKQAKIPYYGNLTNADIVSQLRERGKLMQELTLQDIKDSLEETHRKMVEYNAVLIKQNKAGSFGFQVERLRQIKEIVRGL